MDITSETLTEDRIRSIEELSLNSWPALNSLVYDGWLLRFARSYTRRANSVSALYPSTIKLAEKIAYCEATYAAYHQPPIFKLTPACQPTDLDLVLADQGYYVSSRSMVMVQDNLRTVPAPDHAGIRLLEETSPSWLESYITMNGVDPQYLSTMIALLDQVRLPKAFAAVMHDGVPVALGLAVVERDYVGFYDIVVEAAQRGRGWGRQLMLHLIKFARERGATRGYLQVLTGNVLAIRLYSGLGFLPAYDYWYRTKDVNTA